MATLRSVQSTAQVTVQSNGSRCYRSVCWHTRVHTHVYTHVYTQARFLRVVEELGVPLDMHDSDDALVRRLVPPGRVIGNADELFAALHRPSAVDELSVGSIGSRRSDTPQTALPWARKPVRPAVPNVRRPAVPNVRRPAVPNGRGLLSGRPRPDGPADPDMLRHASRLSPIPSVSPTTPSVAALADEMLSSGVPDPPGFVAALEAIRLEHLEGNELLLQLLDANHSGTFEHIHNFTGHNYIGRSYIIQAHSSAAITI